MNMLTWDYNNSNNDDNISTNNKKVKNMCNIRAKRRDAHTHTPTPAAIPLPRVVLLDKHKLTQSAENMNKTTEGRKDLQRQRARAKNKTTATRS